MPYKYGKSGKKLKKAASFNIDSLHSGPQFAKNVKKFGRDKANQMAIAAGFSIARRGPKRGKRK